MEELIARSKITEHHLDRKAVVYLRQSSVKQVRNNKESQRLQYALEDRAKEWGWKAIEVVDHDLGSSATVGAEVRLGFERLTSSVAMGQVGIIFSREVSRLSRTDKDFCRLLEVCGVFDTLLSDGEQVYDTSCVDDQILLGIKGIMSVAEVTVLQKRMVAAMEEKARRGEFQKPLSPGYIWDQAGKLVKDPNQRVRDAIDLVIKKFREIQSIRQTCLWFHHEGIEVPVTKDVGGKKGLVWQLPTESFIKALLKNALYAGVYEWGRERVQMEYRDGRVVKKRVRTKAGNEPKVYIEDHHEGYIDKARFEEIQEMISRNELKQCQGERVGAAREGQGLLGGLLRCGRCGKKLYVAYYGKSGTAARYVCRGDYASGGSYCLAFGGSTVDKGFSGELLRVVCAYGVEASIEAARMEEFKEEEKSKVVEQKVRDLEYEATRAFEQYNEVDPRHRLVAEELERRWNEKLEEVEKAKQDLNEMNKEKEPLSASDRARLQRLGERFSEVWESEYCPNSLRKKIARTVITEVVVDLDEKSQLLKFIIHWQGGCHTAFEMAKPRSGIGQKTEADDLEIIRKLSIRYGGGDIARVLNKLGRTTATGKRWNESRVGTIRGKYGIGGHIKTVKDGEVLTQAEAAKYLRVSETTIKRLVNEGVVENDQQIPWAPWEIKRCDLDGERVKKIVERLRATGKIIVEEEASTDQGNLFPDL